MGHAPVRLIVGCLVVAGSLLAGCAPPPTVAISYVFPPAAGAPEFGVRLTAGECTVRGVADADAHAAHLQSALEQQLGKRPWGPTEQRMSRELLPDATHAVTARAVLDVTDERSARTLQRWNAETRSNYDVEVDSLVRTAKAEVAFRVPSGDGREVTVETRRSYDSRTDPAVRGPLGLQRADDPENVPPAGDILRELLTESVVEFVQMVSPVHHNAQIQLLAVPDADVSDAMRYVRESRFPEAAGAFAAALEKNPDNAALRFNLAVMRETTGDLDVAEELYEAAMEGLDEAGRRAAAEGARRVRRVRRTAAGHLGARLVTDE